MAHFTLDGALCENDLNYIVDTSVFILIILFFYTQPVFSNLSESADVVGRQQVTVTGKQCQHVIILRADSGDANPNPAHLYFQRPLAPPPMQKVIQCVFFSLSQIFSVTVGGEGVNERLPTKSHKVVLYLDTDK